MPIRRIWDTSKSSRVKNITLCSQIKALFMSSVSLTSPVRGSKLPGRKIKGDLIKTLAIYLPAIGIAYEGYRSSNILKNQICSDSNFLENTWRHTLYASWLFACLSYQSGTDTFQLMRSGALCPVVRGWKLFEQFEYSFSLLRTSSVIDRNLVVFPVYTLRCYGDKVR